MKVSIDTTDWDSANKANFDFNLKELAPSKVVISLKDVESFIEGEITLKKTSKAKFPFMACTLQAEGEAKRNVALGASQALDLVEVIELEPSEETLIGYVSMTDGKFDNENSFNPESGQSTQSTQSAEKDPKDMTIPELKEKVKELGISDVEIKGAKNKQELIELVEMYAV